MRKETADIQRGDSGDQSDWTDFASKHGLWRPVLFTVGFTFCAFAISAQYTESELQKQVEERKRKAQEEGLWGGLKSRLLGIDTFGNHQVIKREPPAQPSDGLWKYAPIVLWRSWFMAQKRWESATMADKTLGAILAVNIGVWALWALPKLNLPMSVFFMHYPPAGRALTMLTSGYSHVGLGHLAFNMLALMSFGSDVIPNIMGGNSSEFLAFYMSAIVFSSCMSTLNAARQVRMGVIARNMVAPSVGASGGIYAVVATVATLFPATKVHVFLIPYPLALGTVFPIMILLDTAGLLLRWRTFDHAAHLGGAVFGYWYVAGGGRQWYLSLRDRARKQLVFS
jgi:rhomboid-like protein